MAKQRISWSTHFIELLVVIIGISIAFALEGWSERKKAKKLEISYLQSLKTDLEKDVISLQEVMDSSQVITNYVFEVFTHIYRQSHDSVYRRHHVTSNYTTPYFSSQHGTYTTLVNSGTINLIEDFALKAALTELYNIQYAQLETLDNKIRKLVDDMIYPYMIQNIRFAADRDGIVSAAPLKTNEAINLMGSYVNFMRITRAQVYTEAKQHCDVLVQKIDEQLKKLE